MHCTEGRQQQGIKEGECVFHRLNDLILGCATRCVPF